MRGSKSLGPGPWNGRLGIKVGLATPAGAPLLLLGFLSCCSRTLLCGWDTSLPLSPPGQPVITQCCFLLIFRSLYGDPGSSNTCMTAVQLCSFLLRTARKLASRPLTYIVITRSDLCAHLVLLLFISSSCLTLVTTAYSQQITTPSHLTTLRERAEIAAALFSL